MAVSRTFPVSRVKPAPRVAKATPAPAPIKIKKQPDPVAVATASSPAQELKRLQQQAARDQYELHLLRDILAMHLPEPTRQYLWHPSINYRADLCWPRERLIVEVDGGVYLRHGHHNSGKGYEYDRIRDAEALTLGFVVLRVTPGMVKDGSAVDYVDRVLHTIWARNKRTA